jgi:hypothetical protein
MAPTVIAAPKLAGSALVLILSGCALLAPQALHAQPVQYQFTPPPPIVPLPFQPSAGTGAVAVPGFAPTIGDYAPVHVAKRSARQSASRRSAAKVASDNRHHGTRHAKVELLPSVSVPGSIYVAPRAVPSRGTTAAVPPAAIPQAPPASQYFPYRGRVVTVPPPLVPGQNSYSDRASRCAQSGAAAGVGANQLGTFTAQCAN